MPEHLPPPPHSLRIGIDGLNLAIPRGTGIATYARALSRCLGEMGHSVDILYGLDIARNVSPAMREVRFFDLLESERGARAPRFPSLGWAREKLRDAAGHSAFEIALTGQVIAAPLAHRLPHYDRLLNVHDMFGRAHRYFRDFGRFLTVRIARPPDIMHWTYPVPIRLAGAANIYTIHDLVPLRLPYTTLDDKAFHVRLLRACLRQGDHIATVSETSRRDILEFFPELPPARVTNTYQAVTPPAAPPDIAEVAHIVDRMFGLVPGGYFLFFGSIEPKKNVGRLLEAYLASDIDMPLVIVGARAWKSEADLALLKHRPPDDRRVRQIDYLPADMLATLIRGARAVVFPSIYEGFGLPVLEAMSLGTPVLTSTAGSLPEVAGDAAVMVDPYDPRDIAAGLARLANDDALCADLHVRGLARSALFDMAHYRERIAAMYREILAAQR